MAGSFRILHALAFVAALWSGASGASAAADPIRGKAVVLDGDTLEIGHLRIRLFGVDAPELDQICWTAESEPWPCGVVARDRAAALVAGAEVGCRPRERDSYGRLIARCSIDGRDLGETLVVEGLAWAYLRFSWRYADGESEARSAGRGIWQGEAQAAWHYRANPWVPAAGRAAVVEQEPEPELEPELEPAGSGQITTVAGSESASVACSIKGNISGRGDRVYHMPGTRWYARTVIETGAGERWFCSTGEAEAAGWRPAAGSR